LWDTQFFGQFADRPFVRLPIRQLPWPTRTGLDNAGHSQKMAHHLGVEGVASFGRTPGFLIEDRSDFGAVISGLMQLCRACHQGRVSAEGLRPRHRSDEHLGRPGSTMPVTFQAHLLARFDHLDQNALKQ